ncbi:MAG: YfhO family protein [bacterium]|nr:YfhO family protein [bacterium]
MNLSAFFKKNGIHFIAIALFFIVAYAYFSPQFNDYGLKQHDIEQYKGMSNEAKHYRELTGEEPLWTNAMFGGMPATQISVLYSGNVLKNVVVFFGTPLSGPAYPFLWHLICFYILALCLRIKPVIGIVGAFAFAFASYEIIILQAGHMTKAMSIAFLPGVLGGFILAYRRNWKLGGIVSAIFMGMHLGANHFQITYYSLFMFLILGIFFLIEAYRKKELKKFAISTAAILGAYVLAIGINSGNIFMTKSYADATIRGKNDVTITPDGLSSKTAASGGLDKDYITRWSYGIGESFTLVTPYAKGSHNNVPLAETRFAPIVEDMELSSTEEEAVLSNRAYFGEQPITNGPVYLGVIVVFLAVLGLVFLRDRIKWAFLAISIFALLLSWGKNFMGLTDFFIDNVPLYNKFRTVTIILILVEVSIPVIGVMLLQKFYEERESLKGEWKKFLIVSGVFFAFLLGLKFVDINDKYYSSEEAKFYNEETMTAQMTQQVMNIPPQALQQNYGVDPNNPAQIQQFIDAQVAQRMDGFQKVKEVRREIYAKSTNHSLLIAFLGIGAMSLLFFTSIPSVVVMILIGIISTADLIVVDRNYLNNDPPVADNGDYQYWIEQGEKDFPVQATPADQQIMDAELQENPELKKKIDAAEREAKEKAEDLELDGPYRQRMIDSYKFFALNMNTNYRVLDFDGLWSSTRSSYFHKCLSGYHAAKLQNIQNVFDFQIRYRNQKVLDMFNVKYEIEGGKLTPRPTAMGNGWFVQEVETYETPNDEVRALGNKFNLNNAGGGQLLINGTPTKQAAVYGGEEMKYVLAPGDSVNIGLPRTLREDMSLYIAMDSTGATNFYQDADFERDSSNSLTKLVALNLENSFEPRTEAVMLASEAKKLSTKKFSGEGSIEMTSYAPNRLTYETKSSKKQLAVFSEVYYKKGWKAFVDGKEQEILKVNYMLRGLELPAGNHKVEFKYDTSQYDTATVIAWIGSILLLLLIGAYIYFEKIRGASITADKSEE